LPRKRHAAEYDFDQALGRRIRERRTALGLSQVEMAGRLGISFQQVQKYESGQNRLSGARLTVLATLLQVPPSWFFEPVDAVPEPEVADRLVIEHQRRFAALPKDVQMAVDKLTRELVRLRGRGRGDS